MIKQRLLFGVGINDADYVTQIIKELPRVGGKRVKKRIWICPFYSVWRAMLKRVYDASYKNSFPTYIEVSICEGWHRFSTFKIWMETQDYKNKELDKDLLSPVSGKVYSPDTCCFIPKQLNMFMTESTSSRGEWPIGVCFVKTNGKFRSQCRNPFTNKQETVGMFTSPLDAHIAWKERKLELAKLLAALEDNPKIANALINKYENYMEVK